MEGKPKRRTRNTMMQTKVTVKKKSEVLFLVKDEDDVWPFSLSAVLCYMLYCAVLCCAVLCCTQPTAQAV